MDCKFEKVWPALALSLVAFTSLANAADDMQMRNLENRVSALEQRRGANGMINPPSRPVVKDGVDLWLEGEALFMHVTEDGMEYAIKSGTDVSFPKGHIKDADYDWSWGFRVGTGYNMPHDGWDLFLNWTWLRSHEHSRNSAESGEDYLGVRQNATSANGVTNNIRAGRVSEHHTLQINLIDLEMGREFFVSKWLTTRPHVGLRGGWIHRNFDISYSSGNIAGGQHVEPQFRNRYRGVGLRSGLDTQWGLGSGWSIYGDVAFSLLYGNHRVRAKQDLESSAGVDTLQQNARSCWMMVRAMTDLGLGFRWDRLCCDDRYRVRLQLAWEQHILFGFNKDIDFVDDVVRGKLTSNRGDLAFSGASVQARFDF